MEWNGSNDGVYLGGNVPKLGMKREVRMQNSTQETKQGSKVVFSPTLVLR
jgi:hypothetical protein